VVNAPNQNGVHLGIFLAPNQSQEHCQMSIGYEQVDT